MKFKVDTGAEVTALTEEALSQLGTIQLGVMKVVSRRELLARMIFQSTIGI